MTLGVALSGGGLKGLANIGELKALEELGLKIDYLSGTSSGSIFATFYAMGYSVDEIKKRTLENYKILTKIEKKPIFKAGYTYLTSGVAKISGLTDGENIENLVKNISKDKNITNMNEIKIPYAIATVDTISTKECIFLSKKFDLKDDDIDYIYDAPIAKATRASMSFPGVYTPCEYGKYNFIDGGTKDNLPVKILKDMGADKTYHDYGFYADEINKFENNIEHLKNGIYSFQTGEKQTFYDNQLFINYQELNRIEKACLIMYQNVQSRIHGRHTLAFILNGGFI